MRNASRVTVPVASIGVRIPPTGASALFPHHFGLPRMRAGPLRQNEETAQDNSRDNRRRGAEYQRSAFVSEAGRIGRPVTERGSQRLRKRDGSPIKHLHLWRADGVNRDRAE